jgi:hypothetical protein
MTRDDLPQLWQVHTCARKADRPEAPDTLRRRFGTPSAVQVSQHEHEELRFLVGPDGVPDARVNAFFASPTMGALSERTNRNYAYSIGVWLNFLLRHYRGRRWFEAQRDEIEDFAFWRMLDERNPRRIRRTTWRSDLAALRAFYDWAARTYGVRNPTPRRERESHRRIERPRHLAGSLLTP